MLKWDPKPEKHFQFERIGFFVVDTDSNLDAKKFVFNLTVNLKEINKPKVDGDSATNRSRKEEQDRQLAAKLVLKIIVVDFHFQKALTLNK